MKLIQTISMDFAFHGIPPRVYGRQDDSMSRMVRIDLFNQGEAWPVPADAAMMVRFNTPAGGTGLYDTMPDGSSAFTVSDNSVTVQLVDQIFATAGQAECSLRIVSEGAGVSTWTFIVDVERGPGEDADLPADYINVLTNLTAEAKAAADRAEKAANSVDTTYLMNKTMYDPEGTVEAAGGIPKYVENNAPKVEVIDSVTSTSATSAASAAAVKKTYDAIPELYSGVDSTSETMAATPAAVKKAYEAAGKYESETLTSENITSENGTVNSSSGLYITKTGKIVMVEATASIVLNSAASTIYFEMYGLPARASAFLVSEAPIGIDKVVVTKYSGRTSISATVTFTETHTSGETVTPDIVFAYISTE